MASLQTLPHGLRSELNRTGTTQVSFVCQRCHQPLKLDHSFTGTPSLSSHVQATPDTTGLCVCNSYVIYKRIILHTPQVQTMSNDIIDDRLTHDTVQKTSEYNMNKRHIPTMIMIHNPLTIVTIIH